MAFIAFVLWLAVFSVSLVFAWWFRSEPLFSRLAMVGLTGVAATGLLTWFLDSRRRAYKERVDIDALIAASPPVEPMAPPIAVVPASAGNGIEKGPWDRYFKVLLSDRPFRETAEKIADLLPVLLPGCTGALYLHNSASQNLQMILAFGDRVIGPQTFAPGDCESFLRGEMQIREEGIPGGPPFCRHMRHADTGISLCAPVECMGQHLGVFCLQHPDGSLDESFVSEWRRQVSILVGSLGLVLANLDLQARFQIHNIRDPLTGMFNRRYFDESLLREVAAAERHRTSIGMILIYPDAVEAYRAHKSQAAEQLLWELGQRLPRYIRTEDIPCRYDGDVLCVLLPGADPSIVIDRADRIRREVEGLEVRFADVQLHTTLSVGVASLPLNGKTARSLSTSCEKALMQAKNKGGNMCVIAERSRDGIA